MTVADLSRAQLVTLKQFYMSELVNEGAYAEIMGVEWDEPSWGELAAADELIPDETVFEHYAGITFSDDDLPE